MNHSPYIVTGGTSFIGRHLIRRLLEEERSSIVLLARDPSKVPQEWHPRVRVIEGDIREKGSLSRLPFEGSVIFHLAGEVEQKPLFYDINVVGTENLISLAASESIRHFIHLSSVGVIGHPGGGKIDETAPCQPLNEYERSKYEGERILHEYYERYKTPMTIFRPSTVFGEESKSRSFLSWMRSIKNGTFRFIRKKSYANYIYVGDVVEALLRVSKAGRTGKDIFILSDGKPMEEFVHSAAKIFKVEISRASIPRWVALMVAGTMAPLANYFRKSFPLTVSRVRALTDQRLFSMEKIKEELGFQPRFGIVEGLQRTLVWYEREGLL
jgi:nucleoside-diphosphate-sugar epimerase